LAIIGNDGSMLPAATAPPQNFANSRREKLFIPGYPPCDLSIITKVTKYKRKHAKSWDAREADERF
jgi:hypothetical protein